jgi:crotonobetainyl-CoA:carnitine CoA-transferase CaiB-like acyl-CoA transferase
VGTDEQWARLRAALGDPAWAADPRLDGYEGRRAGADRLDAELSTWASNQDLRSAVELLISRGVAAGEVVDYRSISAHPQLRARGFFETSDHPLVGSHPVPVQPFRYHGIDRWIRSPAPMLGQHNSEVLTEICGLSADEIDDLRAAGVIGERPVGV